MPHRYAHSNITHDRRSFVKTILGGCVAATALHERIYAQVRAGLQNSAPHATGYVYDARYLQHQHSTETAERLAWLHDYIDTHLGDSITRVGLHTGESATHITRVHTRSHYNSISRIATTGTVAALAVGGALGAVDAVHAGSVRNAFCAIRPPGHHAHNRGAVEGFCFYNNVAIAAMYAREVLGYGRILIVDWDYHHGNGTQDFFLDDPRVLFLSTHNQHDYPYTGDPSITGTGAGEGYTINIHLPCGAREQDIATAWDEQLLPACDTFQPEMILISAGFDSKANDALGCFSVSPEGFHSLTRKLMELASTHCDGNLVSMLEGGYADRGTHEPYASSSSATYYGLQYSGGAHVAALAGQDMPPLHTHSRASSPRPPTSAPALYVRDGLLVLEGIGLTTPALLTLYSTHGRLLQRLHIDESRMAYRLTTPLPPGHYIATLHERYAQPRQLTVYSLD